jgi:hypothetical protein
MMIAKARRARMEHPCAGCRGTIPSGLRHVEVKHHDDSVPFRPTRPFKTERFHSSCVPEDAKPARGRPAGAEKQRLVATFREAGVDFGSGSKCKASLKDLRTLARREETLVSALNDLIGAAEGHMQALLHSTVGSEIQAARERLTIAIAGARKAREKNNEA